MAASPLIKLISLTQRKLFDVTKFEVTRRVHSALKGGLRPTKFDVCLSLKRRKKSNDVTIKTQLYGMNHCSGH